MDEGDEVPSEAVDGETRPSAFDAGSCDSEETTDRRANMLWSVAERRLGFASRDIRSWQTIVHTRNSQSLRLDFERLRDTFDFRGLFFLGFAEERGFLERRFCLFPPTIDGVGKSLSSSTSLSKVDSK